MKIENCKLNIILFSLSFTLCAVILHFAFCVLSFGEAYADDISLSVSPSLIQIQAASPAERKASLTLQNEGDEALGINILLKPFRPLGESGQIEYIINIDNSYQEIFKKVKLTDNGIAISRLELGPKQKKNLELQFIIPKNEKSSDYYFSVIFLARRSLLSSEALAKLDDEAGLPSTIEQSSNEAIKQSDNETTLPVDRQVEQSNISSINAGIAANVLLSIGSKNRPQATIEEFSAPGFLQSGPVEFTVRIKNTGSRYITPKGIIFIKNMFGQTIGRLDIETANILSGSIRSLTAGAAFDADTQTASNFSPSSDDPNQFLAPRSPAQKREVGPVQNILWRENFLLGPHTATLNLALSEKGPIYNQSIVFLVLPIQLAIVTIIAMVISIAVILRVRYHLKVDK